ncbi:MAG: LysR family transcriptional regulator [Eubacteriales bacterium]
MNLDYLKTFYTSINENSISKAAKILHMSQPGVSIQLQALEKELGFLLLIRSNKGVELTDAGRIVYDYAVSLLSIQKNIHHDLDSLKNNVQEMVVSSCTTVGSYALPCSLYTFKNKNPNIKILLDITNSKNVITNLLNNNTKIGIIHGNPKVNDIYTEKITSSHLYLVCKNVNNNISVTLEQLTKLPLIVREKGSGTRQCIEENLIKENLDLNQMNIVLELCSTEAIKSAVLSGKGFAFLPELSIKQELATKSLKIITIEDKKFESHFYLAYLKEKPPKGPEKCFFDFVKSSKRGFC